MGAANEPIVYSGAMIVAVLLFVIGTTAAGGILEKAFDKMDFQQSRYESVQRGYLYAADGLNYNFTFPEATSNIDPVNGEGYCVFNTAPKNFTFYNGSAEMHITTYDGGPVRMHGGSGNRCMGLSISLDTAPEEFLRFLYPPVAFNVNNPSGNGPLQASGSNPGEADVVKVYPAIY